MDPRERMMRALYGEEPDFLPVFELAIGAPIAKEVLGRTPKVDSYLVVDPVDYYKIYRGFGLDGMTIWDVGLPVKYLDKVTYMDDWGRMWKTSGDSHVTFYVRGTIHSPEDFENFSPPDPHNYERLEPLRKVTKINRAKLAVVGGIHDAFEIPSMMRDMENFLVDFYRNPTFAKKIVETSTEYNIELAKAMIDLGADAIMSGDDYAYNQGPMMSQAHFKEFVFPYLKKVVDVVHRRGIPFLKHTDGYLWPILDMLVNTGVDALHPIEPQAKMSLRDVKDKYGDALCLMGNVDVTNVLPFGTVRETIDEVKRCIEEAASGGGYILSSSNSIHDAVKVENFKAMIKAARRYGKYPLRAQPAT